MNDRYWQSEDGLAELWCGDCVTVMDAMPARSVQCCVSSPPYWGLRDYKLTPIAWPEISYSPMPGLPPITIPAMEANLGLEATPEAFVAHIVHVYRSVRRVLRDDGTCWIDFGDSYASGGTGRRDTDGEYAERRAAEFGSGRGNGNGPREYQQRPTPQGLKPKDMCGMPWRVAFALQADGWWLRSDIIWAKKNCMPSSVKDRCTTSHEYLFMLSKKARYYFDQEAVREDGPTYTRKASGYKEHEQREVDGYHGYTGHGGFGSEDVTTAGRNKRTVWSIATQACKESHFATFPEKLIEPCILAGTSAAGCCPQCGAPWTRVVEKKQMHDPARGWDTAPGAHKREKRREDAHTDSAYEDGTTAKRLALLRQKSREEGTEYANQTKTIGWRPSCKCEADEPPVACAVLDHFAGSGTAVAVAARLGRRGVGIELSETYCRDIAIGRIEKLRQPKKIRVKKIRVIPEAQCSFELTF